MDLANEKVVHARFGEGRIVKYDDSYMEIVFTLGNKRFVFPDAFGTYVKLVDQKAAQWARQLVQKSKKDRKAIKLKREQRRANAAKKRKRLLAARRASKPSRSRRRKIHPQSQSVFWCQEEELSQIFSEWSVFAGAIKSGENKGLPRRLARIGNNTVCLLTVRSPQTKERKRRIVGAFLVNNNFKNEPGNDGIIPAHPKYRIRLTESESEPMLFWNYYINKRYPQKMTWNSGRHRYFDNIWMAQILRDIITLKTDSQERDLATSFFEHFCRVNLINAEKLPQPNGVLLRSKNP